MLRTWKYERDGNEDVFFHCICSCTLDYVLWILPLFLSIKQLHKVNFLERENKGTRRLISQPNQQVFILLFISVDKSNNYVNFISRQSTVCTPSTSNSKYSKLQIFESFFSETFLFRSFYILTFITGVDLCFDLSELSSLFYNQSFLNTFESLV